MKSILATLALVSLTGCGTIIPYDPDWISKNVVMGNSNNYRSTVISTPQGTYTVRSTTTGSTSQVQVSRTHR